MLRFLLLVSVCLSALFTLVGAALSQESNWNESASDELYVVYWQGTQTEKDYWLINIDGNSEAEKFEVQGEVITSFDCSPDGRTLALMTNVDELYVIDETGILYRQPVDLVYNFIQVVNNGAVVFSDKDNDTLVNRDQVEILIPPSADEFSYYHVEVSSENLRLWSSYDNGVELVSPDGELLMSFPYARYGMWLASERFFTFDYTSEANEVLGFSMGEYFIDSVTGAMSKPMLGIAFGALSPDLTKRVALLGDSTTGDEITFVGEAFSGTFSQRLIENVGENYLPMCFLTFRPEMLIDQSS